MVLQGAINNGNRSHSDADTYYLSDQGTFTPVGAQGGFHIEPPLRKPLSHRNFAMKFEICTMYVWTIKNHNSEEKKN